MCATPRCSLMRAVITWYWGPAVALPDGAEQAVDVCFDLTAAPAGDFSLAFDGGLTLSYADAARMGL